MIFARKCVKCLCKVIESALQVESSIGTTSLQLFEHSILYAFLYVGVAVRHFLGKNSRDRSNHV